MSSVKRRDSDSRVTMDAIGIHKPIKPDINNVVWTNNHSDTVFVICIQASNILCSCMLMLPFASISDDDIFPWTHCIVHFCAANVSVARLKYAVSGWCLFRSHIVSTWHCIHISDTKENTILKISFPTLVRFIPYCASFIPWMASCVIVFIQQTAAVSCIFAIATSY